LLPLPQAHRISAPPRPCWQICRPELLKFLIGLSDPRDFRPTRLPFHRAGASVHAFTTQGGNNDWIIVKVYRVRPSAGGLVLRFLCRRPRFSTHRKIVQPARRRQERQALFGRDRAAQREISVPPRSECRWFGEQGGNRGLAAEGPGTPPRSHARRL